MKTRLSALTLTEVVVIIFIVIGLAIFILPLVLERPGGGRKANCKENLSQIGKAIYVYTQNFNDYYPFIWGPATGEGAPSFLKPKPAATTACCDAATSIGCLYPQYMPTANVFRCPSTENAPSFLMTAPYMPSGKPATAASDPYLFSQRTWSLVSVNPNTSWGASYGYDCRIAPSAASGHIMADMDGSWQVNRNTLTQNHDGGQNVLYVDGSVKWMATNYVSNDPIDNIYEEGGARPAGGGPPEPAAIYWSADTDSFVVRGSVLLGPSWRALCDDMKAGK